MSVLAAQVRGVRSLWRYRDLVTGLTTRNLKVKYKRSVLGFVWTLVNPGFTVAILVAVFTHVVRVQIEAYWAFLISGYFVWNFFGQTLMSATYVLNEHSQLSRAVAYPKEAPILAAALSRLVEFSIELALVLVILVALHHGHAPPAFLLLPWLVVLQLVTALGLALAVATLSTFYHDVQHAVPILLTTLFYVSPVFYAAEMVPEAVRPLYMANPIAGLLTLFQTVLYSGQSPPPDLLLGMSLFATAVLLVGYGIFAHYQHLLAEVV
jgi:ABC-type polysaccharide/polyol phosphate export permease